MHLYADRCTNKGCRCGNPILPKFPEGNRSRGWAYCNDCYIRIFPKAAAKKRLIEVPKAVVKTVKQNNTKGGEVCSRCSRIYDPETVYSPDMLLCWFCYRH